MTNAPHYLSPLLAPALDRLTEARCELLVSALGRLSGPANDLVQAIVDEALARQELTDLEFVDLVDDDDE